jgi:hypothetical protein
MKEGGVAVQLPGQCVGVKKATEGCGAELHKGKNRHEYRDFKKALKTRAHP